MRKYFANRNMTKNALYFTWHDYNKKNLGMKMTTDDDKLLEAECVR